MPSINKAIELCTAILNQSPTAVPFLKGKPGMGKSDATLQIGDALGIPPERQLVVHVNNHDVVDFTGVPSVVDGETVFNPTKMFHDYREGTGAGLIVLEELPQSSNHHQTWAAGFILERQTPTFKLDPAVRIIVTGNRTEDKAGARPLLSHLSDRMYHIEIESSIDDWSTWAMGKGLPFQGVAFLRLRPELLNTFDPTNEINATQRSWTKLFTDVPLDLEPSLYLTAAKGKVGEAAAAEWTAVKDQMERMPSIDAIRNNPSEFDVPSEINIRYAVTAAMATTTDDDVFPADTVFINRMPKEFQALYYKDVITRKPELTSTTEFVAWATTTGKSIMLGDK